jgi:hypothetical protein
MSPATGRRTWHSGHGAPPSAYRGAATTRVPVPPTAEQARIVETVGGLIALCDRLEEVIQRAEDTRVALATAIVGSTFAQLSAD